MQVKRLLNENEWKQLTEKRLKRWCVSKEQFLKEAEEAESVDEEHSLLAWIFFVNRYKIPINKDKSVPYGTRVKLAGYTMKLAIQAKSELEFRQMIDAEIAQTAQKLGILL